MTAGSTADSCGSPAPLPLSLGVERASMTLPTLTRQRLIHVVAGRMGQDAKLSTRDRLDVTVEGQTHESRPPKGGRAQGVANV